MWKIVLTVDAPGWEDPQGIKETVAMQLEALGDVRVESVELKGKAAQGSLFGGGDRIERDR